MPYIIDISIVVGLISGAMIGFRRGVFAQTINFVGVIISVIGAFLFKNWLSAIFCKCLPFLNFNDIIIFNVLFYEILAFAIVFALFLSIFKILFTFTDIFERVLKMTIILGIPSKILGAVMGVLQAYLIIVFIVIFFWQPALSVVPVEESRLANAVVTSANNRLSPLNGMINTFREITEIEEVGVLNDNEMNLRVLDVMLKRGITKVELIEDLVEMDKLPINNIESVLNKYR